jgi:hypothetical protein
MAPTRELAFQIAQSFEALGSEIGVKCAVIVGGMDMVSQAFFFCIKSRLNCGLTKFERKAQNHNFPALDGECHDR